MRRRDIADYNEGDVAPPGAGKSFSVWFRQRLRAYGAGASFIAGGCTLEVHHFNQDQLLQTFFLAWRA
jgi:hypothetical protein